MCGTYKGALLNKTVRLRNKPSKPHWDRLGLRFTRCRIDGRTSDGRRSTAVVTLPGGANPTAILTPIPEHAVASGEVLLAGIAF